MKQLKEWSNIAQIILRSGIGNTNQAALVTPFTNRAGEGDILGNHLVALSDDTILKNHLTDFLLCRIDIPNPVSSIGIKFRPEHIDVLAVVANLLGKRDQFATFEFLNICSHSSGAVILGQKRSEVFLRIGIFCAQVTDGKGNVAVRFGLSHIVAVCNSTITVNQLFQNSAVGLKLHRRKDIFNRPNREREFFHLVPDAFPRLLHRGAEILGNPKGVRSSLIKRLLRFRHCNDILVLVARIRCDL